MSSKNNRYQCSACHHIYSGIPNVIITGRSDIDGTGGEFEEEELCNVCYDRI